MEKNIIIYTFIYFIHLTSFCQKIDYNNFNNKLMNNAMLIEFNNFRKKNNLDTLIYSEELFNNVSKPNCLEVSDSSIKSNFDVFYHPDLNKKANNLNIKNRLILDHNNNFNKKINNKIKYSVYENAFKTNINKNTYQEMAKYAIFLWSKSESHSKTQNLNFNYLKMLGIFSCHSVYTSKKVLYIYINFAKIDNVN